MSQMTVYVATWYCVYRTDTWLIDIAIGKTNSARSPAQALGVYTWLIKGIVASTLHSSTLWKIKVKVSIGAYKFLKRSCYEKLFLNVNATLHSVQLQD